LGRHSQPTRSRGSIRWHYDSGAEIDEIDVMDSESMDLRILGQVVRITWDDPASAGSCLAGNFGAMVPSPSPTDPDFAYKIRSVNGSFLVEREDTAAQLVARGLDELVYCLEKDLTVELQRRRPDLFFLHGATLEWRGAAVVLAADSGSGKSTTAWALLHHGFRYLSDELACIEPDTLCVFAYPHAVCLKRAPPAPYVLPDATLHLGRTSHVPTTALPAPLADDPLPLGAVFLIRYDSDLASPQLRRLGAAEASARIYVTALNALAHPDRGLGVALQIAQRVPCFALGTAGLGESCEIIRTAIDRTADQ
jgi:hypothetical protein